MKRALKAIYYFLGYCIYFLITMNERERYMKGKAKGMRCIDSYDSSRFFYGSATTYVYDKTKKPERTFTSWREFWGARGYGRNKSTKAWRDEFKELVSAMTEHEFTMEYARQIRQTNPTRKDDWKLQHMVHICHEKAAEPLTTTSPHQ